MRARNNKLTGLHLGNGTGVWRADRVRRAPLLRWIKAVRRAIVRRPGIFGLLDIATDTGRLC